MTVNSGATLAGTGTVNGTVNASVAGAIISPGVGAAGTLYISNNLTLGSGSILNFDIGVSSDQIAVTGNLTLNGTINLSGVAGAATKTILTYTGTLTGSGLTIGSIASGYSATISTATANQVNLIIVATITPVWSATGLGTIQGGALTESAIYLGAYSSDSLYCRSLSDGSRKWSYYTGNSVSSAAERPPTITSAQPIPSSHQKGTMFSALLTMAEIAHKYLQRI